LFLFCSVFFLEMLFESLIFLLLDSLLVFKSLFLFGCLFFSDFLPLICFPPRPSSDVLGFNVAVGEYVEFDDVGVSSKRGLMEKTDTGSAGPIFCKQSNLHVMGQNRKTSLIFPSKAADLGQKSSLVSVLCSFNHSHVISICPPMFDVKKSSSWHGSYSSSDTSASRDPDGVTRLSISSGKELST